MSNIWPPWETSQKREGRATHRPVTHYEGKPPWGGAPVGGTYITLTTKETPRHGTQPIHHQRIQSQPQTTTSTQPHMPLVRQHSHHSRPPHRSRPRRNQPTRQPRTRMQPMQLKTRTGIQSTKRRSTQGQPRTSHKRHKTVF